MEQDIELFHTKVVGVSFEGRQYILQAIERFNDQEKEEIEVTLRREPDNEYDRNAIAVDVTYIDPTFMSKVTRQLGYIKRDLAVDLAPRMDAGEEFMIYKFDSTGDYSKTRGINLSVIRKESGMTKVTVMDLLNRKAGGTDYRTQILKMEKDSVRQVRFLRPLSEAVIQATHSFPIGGGKYERFECPKMYHGDDTQVCPGCAVGNDPWKKLIVPVIDRAESSAEFPLGKVKLFVETFAVYKKLMIFEEEPKNEVEKQIKFGTLTGADIQLMQQGIGKDRQINAFPVGGTVRPLNDQEKAMDTLDPRGYLRLLTQDEMKLIVDKATGDQMKNTNSAMNMRGPLDN